MEKLETTKAKTKSKIDWKDIGLQLASTAVSGLVSGVAAGLGAVAVNRLTAPYQNTNSLAESNVVSMKKVAQG